MTGEIKAICISEKRGTQKYEIPEAELITEFGIRGDAHAGKWHRQVSLLSYDEIENFKQRGASVDNGAFGENIIIEGYDLKKLPIGSRFTCGEVVLDLTQVGKQCHSHCEIYKQVGDCIMPREGVFTRVINGGKLKKGDVLTLTLPGERAYKTGVITMSDKGAAGEREDLSGPAIRKCLPVEDFLVSDYMILPDEREGLERELKRLCQEGCNLILTTGGTGFSKRDITPEATLAVAERNAPGIAEAIRAESMKYTNRAMLSRAVSVIRGECLIINLPGSPKAVRESLEIILPGVKHGLDILTGRDGECGR